MLFYSSLDIFILSANDAFLVNGSILELGDEVTVEALIDPGSFDS